MLSSAIKVNQQNDGCNAASSLRLIPKRSLQCTEDCLLAATFESVKRWLRDLKENSSSASIMLIGNKSDLVGQRAVPKEEAQVKCKIVHVSCMCMLLIFLSICKGPSEL